MKKFYRLLLLVTVLLNISVSFIHLNASQVCPTQLPAANLISLIENTRRILEERLGTPMQPNAGIMQSLIIPNASKVVFVGDLHGDVASLHNNITRMQQEGIFERTNTKKLVSDYYLVFTGDYTDRGYHGIEVWQILMDLLQENPNKVFLLKGNHDNEQSATTKNFLWDFVFRKEIHIKYPGTDTEIFEKFKTLWNLIPQALFIGASYQTNGSHDLYYHYMLCCHGALEPLLIGKIRELLNVTTQRSQPNAIITSLFNDTDFNLSSDFPFFQKLTNLLQPRPTTQNNGFLWYDIHKNEPEKSRRGPGLMLYNPAPYLITFLQNQKITGTNKNWSIDSIMRGHEHQNKSVAKISQAEPQILMDGRYMSVANNDVFTFISSPEGVLTHYDAYAVVQLNRYPWILTPKITSIPPLAQFCTRCNNDSNSLKTAITETVLSKVSYDEHQGKVPWQDIRLSIMANPKDPKIVSLTTKYPYLCWNTILDIALAQKIKYENMLKFILEDKKISYTTINPQFPRMPALVNLKNYTFKELTTIQQTGSQLAKSHPTSQEEWLDIQDNFINPAFINRAHAAWVDLKRQLSLDGKLELSNLNKINLRDWHAIERSGRHVLQEDWDYFYNKYLRRIKPAIDDTAKQAFKYFVRELKKREDLNLPNLTEDISSLRRLTRDEIEQLTEPGTRILRGDWDYMRETYIEPLRQR